MDNRPVRRSGRKLAPPRYGMGRYVDFGHRFKQFPREVYSSARMIVCEGAGSCSSELDQLMYVLHGQIIIHGQDICVRA
jgi:hypothetical protein